MQRDTAHHVGIDAEQVLAEGSQRAHSGVFSQGRDVAAAVAVGKGD